MTLQELIDELNDLPASARSAIVWIDAGGFDDLDVASVRYADGDVVIKADAEPDDVNGTTGIFEDDDEDEDDDDNG